MLGMGPIIWGRISRADKPASREKAALPGYPFSHRYYRAIDSVTRGERLVNHWGFFIRPAVAYRKFS